MRRPLLSLSFISSTLLAVAAPGAETITGFAPDGAVRPMGRPVFGDPAAAQDTIVVTADRQPGTVERTTASVDVVDAEEQRTQGHAPLVGGMLRDVAGIDLIGNGGPMNAGRGIQLRGTGTADTRVLIDGIPAGDPASPNGAADFNTIDATGLDRIEVVRGPQSSLYGSGAVGGVVNLLTVRPTRYHQVGLRLEGGSFATLGGQAVATGPATSTLGYAISVGGLRTSGFSAQTDGDAVGRPSSNETDGARRGSANGRVEWRPAEPLMVYGSGRTETLTQEFDGYLSPDDDTSRTDQHRHRGAAGGTLDLGRGSLATDAARTVTTRDTDSQGISRNFRGIEDYAAIRATGEALAPGHTREAFDRLSVTVGADTTRDQAITSANFDESDHLNGVYGQVLAGGRYFELSESARRDQHSREGGASTWRSGAAAFLADGAVKLHGSIGRSFRAPSLNDLYAPTYGNPDLQASRSIGLDLGHVTNLPGDVTIENTYFRTTWDQDIGFDPTTYVSANTDGYRVDGVESAVSLRDGAPGFRLRASWTAQRTNLDEADIANNKGFIYLPRHKVAIRPSWHHHRGFVAVRLEAVGQRTASSYSFRPEMAGYAVVSASAGLTLDKTWDVYARGENLGNAPYELNPGYSTSPVAGYVGVTGTF